MADDTEKTNQGQEPIPEYFARIPYKLFEARESGQITPSMFLAMLWCYRWADWSTGSIEKMCAERLVWATDGESARRTFQEALHSLAEAHWIISHCPRGGTRPYRVDICNYVALSGARKGQILNPSEIKTWRKSRKRARVGSRVGSAQGVRADAAHHDGDHDGEENGEPSAPTMRVSTENTTRDSSGDSGSRDLDSEPPRIYSGQKSETAKPAKPEFTYPPETAKIVANLQSMLRSYAFEFPQAIPVSKLQSLREFFLEETNAIGIPFPEAPLLYERAVSEFLNPAPAKPPAPTPEPTPPNFAALNPKQRAHALNVAKSHPYWKVYGRFESYVRKTFGQPASKLSPDQCLTAWFAAINGPQN